MLKIVTIIGVRSQFVKIAVVSRAIAEWNLPRKDEKFILTPYLLKQLDLYIDELERENYSRIKLAIERMRDIYSKVLCPFVMRL